MHVTDSSSPVVFRGGRSLEPDLNLIPVRIGDVRVGEAGTKLATPQQSSSGVFDLGDCAVDVVRVYEAKAEMRHAPDHASHAGVLGEGHDVVSSGRPGVDEAAAASVFTETKDLLVKSEGAGRVADGKIDVREAVSLNHRNLSVRAAEARHDRVPEH